jgi:integrase
MLVTVQTGLRVSELITLRRNDIHLGAGAHVACHGKGRKDRITPLTKPAGPSNVLLARRILRHPNRSGVPDTHRPLTEP